ncbi:MAG TPA: guanylate kinase [Acidimicrobiales bacterium]
MPGSLVIVIVSGPGGVGKGTVVSRLLELEPQLWLSRSWTTRARRPGEPENAYVFVDRPTFEARRAAGGFIEWTEFRGTGELYGTPTVDAPDGRDVLLEIELDGAQQIKRRYPDAVLILIVAPSQEEQEQRLRSRGDGPDSVQRRLEVGRNEEGLGRDLADYVVVNDDVDRAAREVAGILRAHHSRC